jgi:hypothetical protein
MVTDFQPMASTGASREMSGIVRDLGATPCQTGVGVGVGVGCAVGVDAESSAETSRVAVAVGVGVVGGGVVVGGVGVGVAEVEPSASVSKGIKTVGVASPYGASRGGAVGIRCE